MRRGVLPSIVTFLTNDDFDVKLIAAQTICFLASHPDNRALMVQEKHLLLNLYNVYSLTCEHKRTSAEESMYKLIHDVLAFLCEHISSEDAKSLPPGFSKMMEQYELQLGQSSTHRSYNQSQQMGFELQKKHNLIIVVDELKRGEQVRSQLQKLILSTPGTISYTINLSNNRVTLYTRTPTDRLLEVFAKSGLTSTTVVMDAICETEFRKPSGSGEADELDKENQEPEYLSPEISNDTSAYKKSLVAFGQAETLEQRIAKRKKRQRHQKQQQEESGFLTKLTSLRFW